MATAFILNDRDIACIGQNFDNPTGFTVEWWDSTTGGWALVSTPPSLEEAEAKVRELIHADLFSMGGEGSDRYRITVTSSHIAQMEYRAKVQA